MNAEEIRNKIAALQNRASSLIVTDESKMAIQSISVVIDNHMLQLDEILENVKVSFLDKMLTNLSNDIDDTEKTLAQIEAKFGTSIIYDTIDTDSDAIWEAEIYDIFSIEVEGKTIRAWAGKWNTYADYSTDSNDVRQANKKVRAALAIEIAHRKLIGQKPSTSDRES